MDTQHFMSVILDLGKKMLQSGAEIYRAEDTIKRICFAYNAERVDVFAITSAIFLTVKFKNEQPYTQIMNVKNYKTDLEYLNKLNDFSRSICRQTPPLESIKARLEDISKNPYPKWVTFFAYAIISSSFSFYAGGSVFDAIVSAITGILLALASIFIGQVKINRIFGVFCSAVFCGIIAVILFKLGAGNNIDKIMIGNIMIFIPGLAATNSVRDMINGDTVSGLMRLTESVISVIAIAAGFAVAAVPFGL